MKHKKLLSICAMSALIFSNTSVLALTNDYTTLVNDLQKNILKKTQSTIQSVWMETWDNINIDTDGDGTPNYLDWDIDNDGTKNGTDTDVDGDGQLNVVDGDIDGDNIKNAIDTDVDGDGIKNALDGDIDGDTISNAKDKDTDGDGIANAKDKIRNGLGTKTDLDGDGIMNMKDGDIDGDTIPNSQDTDVDGDGQLNTVDNDDDNDMKQDSRDQSITGIGTQSDIDGDGKMNSQDADIDGDGVVNIKDTDSDGDMQINAKDTDDDNDGTSDATDTSSWGLGFSGDIDGDGKSDTSDEDSDGDGLVNSKDFSDFGDWNFDTGVSTTNWDVFSDDFMKGFMDDFMEEKKPTTPAPSVNSLVCAQPPMPSCKEGFACIQMMPAPKTYENKDAMYKENASYLYSGKCKSVVEETIPTTDISFICTKTDIYNGLCTSEGKLRNFPLCGQPPMQEKATGLGDSLFTLYQPEPKTYTDYKTFRNDQAKFLYEGKCKETTSSDDANWSNFMNDMSSSGTK